MRIEPPPSVACAIGSARAATRAAAPPLEPPTLRSRSHGLRVGPCATGSVVALKANSGARVRAMTRSPAARTRWPKCVSATPVTPLAGPAATELGDLPLQVWGDLLQGERHARERAFVACLERGREKLADRGPERRIDLADRTPGGVLDLRGRHVTDANERRETDAVACRIVAQFHGAALPTRAIRLTLGVPRLRVRASPSHRATSAGSP